MPGPEARPPTPDENAIGHDGGTLRFFSTLRFFPEQGIGIFASINGTGDIKRAQELPNPVPVIATRLRPKAQEAKPLEAAAFPVDDHLVGDYHPSPRAESSALRLREFTLQVVVRTDGAADLSVSPAIWPFAAGQMLEAR